MCFACQMEDELWLAYLDQTAQTAAQQARLGDKPGEPVVGAAEPAPATQASSAAPFVCEELPSE
jgi:hypothetical protein